MEILTTSTGSYPRIGDKLEEQKLRRAYASWERGEISDREFWGIEDEVAREVIGEQVHAGLDLVTDGQVRWYDPISHLARRLEGCEIGGLLRYFDTNFYFRQPIIVGEVRWREPLITKEFIFAKEVSPVPVKPVVTGPYTLAKLSINRRGVELASIVREFAETIAREVGELAEAGARLIQLDEPAILKNPAEFELLENALGRIAKKAKAKLALYTYFGDAAPVYEKLVELPADTIGFDFTYSPELVKLIASKGCSKELGLGLIDGRNTKLESEREVLDKLKLLLPKIEAERANLNPSCGLEYLPREAAFKKLRNMVTIAREAGGLV